MTATLTGDLFASPGNAPGQGGFDAHGAVRATDRLFFAVHPDADTAARISQLALRLREQQGLQGAALPPERLHVTLHHLGDYVGVPADVCTAARAAGASLRADALDVVFDHAASFPARGRAAPFVLRGGAALQSLDTLQRLLGERMAAAGIGRLVERRFTPHVTLLYDRIVVPSTPIAPLAFRVNGVSLVHSLLGRSEHRILAHWPLRDAV